MNQPEYMQPEEELLDDEIVAPDQVEGVESESQKAARMAMIESYSAIIKQKRTEAIEGRKQSGIEEVWAEDEMHYEGCDQYNKRYGWTKGRGPSDPIKENTKVVKGRSTAFANITRPYCDAAAARVSDMLLPTDDRNWAIRPTPVPTLEEAKQDMSPAMTPDGQPMMQATHQPGMMSRIGGAMRSMFGGAQQASAPMQQMTVADVAAQVIEKAKKSADIAQQTIDDWLVECKYHAEVRRVVESCTRIGVGIIKGPVPTKKKSRVVTNINGQWQMQMEIKISPSSVFVDPWNFYPDPNCGDRISKGSYVFECDDLTAKGLIELKGTPGYIDEMIDMCIEEGPQKRNEVQESKTERQPVKESDLYKIWYFQGMVSKKDMIAAGCECDLDEAPCIVTMVNDRVIKITMSPLDSGEFTYDVMVWQEKIGHWAGIGVARQMRTCQQGLNGAVRAMMDNAGLSSGPQIVVDRNKVDPADGKWEITPRKIWWAKPSDDGVFDARMAFIVVNIETRQAELLNIITWWSKEAEDVTGLPMLMQGQQGAAPETVGGMNMLNNNANSVLRRIARTFDDRVTEPHIGRYYEWLLLHGPDEAKGDFQIDARGSSALVERDIQNQAMMQLLGASLNPAYSLDPEKVMKEVLKGMRLDPKAFFYDDEKKQAMANQPPPEDPRVTAAKIVAESKQGAINADMQKEQMRLQADAQQNDLDRQLERMRIEIDGQLGAAGLTSEQQQTFQKLKVDLSGLTMKLKVQQELSARAQAHDTRKQALAAPSEPAGRAQPGRSYEQ